MDTSETGSTDVTISVTTVLVPRTQHKQLWGLSNRIDPFKCILQNNNAAEWSFTLVSLH